MATVVAEKQGDGRPTAKAGLYRHKETGAEVIATETEKFGNPQGDAYVRLGFEYVGPVTKKADVAAVNAIPDPHAAPIASTQGVKSAAELRAELAEAEAREAAFAEARGEKSTKDDAAQEEAVEDAKEKADAEGAKAKAEAKTASDASKKEGK